MKTLTADVIKNADGFVGAPVEKTVTIAGNDYKVWIRKESVGLTNAALSGIKNSQDFNHQDFNLSRYCNAIVNEEEEPIFSIEQMKALTDKVFSQLLKAFNEVNPPQKKT